MSHVLTLVADRTASSLSPALVARVRDAIQGGPPTILSAGEAADIPTAGWPDRAMVAAALAGEKVDAIPIESGGRRKSLLLADMDSTIITSETLDELADFAGLKDEIAAITARAMNGELDFAEALRARVGMLKGLPLDALDKTWLRVRLTPGARELVATMRAHGAKTVLVSGGFTFFTGRVARLLGFDLPLAAVPSSDYAGPARIIVPTVRTSAAAGEALRLRVIVASEGHPGPVELCWRSLGGSAYAREPFARVARKVYEARLPALDPANPAVEYHVEARIGAAAVRWPASDRGLDQTVILFERS